MTTDNTASKELELLPCPFCGASAGNVPLSRGHGFIVGCGSCQAQQFAMSRDEAVTAWNSRAAVAAPREDADARQIAERIVRDAGQHRHRGKLIADIETAVTTGERKRLGYDPVAHAENMQWLKEREAERLSRPPQVSDPDAAIRAVPSPAAPSLIAEQERCGYCASPDHFSAAAALRSLEGLPDVEGLWHRSSTGGYYRCTAVTPPPATAKLGRIINKWRSTLTEQSFVSDEDAEDLMLRLIAGRFPSAVPVEEQEKG